MSSRLAKTEKPCLALSLGDPGGIGPEVAAKALADRSLARAAHWVVCGSPASVPKALQAVLAPRAGLSWVALPDAGRWRLGRPSAASGALAAQAVRAGARLALSGQALALVTAPLSKEALRLAGEPWPGHTEMLAQLCGLRPQQVGMLLAGGGLRVFLVTRHLSLRRAIDSLSPQAVVEAARLAGKGLAQRFGLKEPRLALAALNPHAGEAGAFGDEEERVLAPALRRLRQDQGFSVQGPYAADTVFVKALRGEFDAVLCLYHDQGLIPLKLLAFDSGVNATLGLPFARTSPDHGTAFDIAGRGIADPGSMKAAMRMALDMAARQGRGR